MEPTMSHPLATAGQSDSNHGEKRGNHVLRQRLAYTFSGLGQAAFYGTMSTYFVVYVTNALFSNVDKSTAARLIGIITSLIVVIRIAEIFVDPLLGNLIDNTKMRLGRFRPWQLIGGLVSAALLVMVYTGLFGLVNVNQTWFIVLFIVVFVLLDVFYSLRDISFWGMIPALSEDSHERSIYTSLGSFGASIGNNGVTVLVVPIVTYFSLALTGSHTQNQSGWAAFGIIIALLAAISAFSGAFGTREKESSLRTKARKNGNPLKAFAALAKNDQMLWVALSYLFYAIANTATGGVLFYLFKFVLNKPDAFSIVGIIPVITGLITTPLYPIINRRIPRRYLFISGMVLMIAGYVLFIVASSNLTVVIVALILFYLPSTFIQMTAILSMTDSVEYGQLKTGERNEAVTLSVRPMLDKIAGALSNGIVGFIAVAAGMVGSATASDMSAANIHTYKLFAFYTPLAFIVVSALVFIFTVRIDERMHARIVSQIERQMESDATKD